MSCTHTNTAHARAFGSSALSRGERADQQPPKAMLLRAFQQLGSQLAGHGSTEVSIRAAGGEDEADCVAFW